MSWRTRLIAMAIAAPYPGCLYRQKANGEYLGRPPPFGYRHDDNRKLVPVPEQQRELRRIHKLHAEGLSPYKISADLATRGIKLSHVTVRKIIAGRRIAA